MTAYLPREQWLALQPRAIMGTMVLVLDAKGRVLLLQDAPDEAREADGWERRWLPPGGMLEEGEDPMTAALREAAEETRLRLPLRVLGTEFISATETWPVVINHYFAAGALTDDEVSRIRLSAEHTEHRFVEPEEAERMMGQHGGVLPHLLTAYRKRRTIALINGQLL